MTEFQASKRFSADRTRLARLLAGLEASGQCRYTAYLKPQSLGSPESLRASEQWAPAGDAGLREELAAAARGSGKSDVGLVTFFRPGQIVAVTPPFPIEAESFSEGAETAHLVELLSRNMTLAVVLLRLGRYAVGLLRGDELVASKSGSRYVKSRHRAGGTSQRRFERSRERLIRELFDKTCVVARDILEPHQRRLDYVLMGGERQTLQGFVRRCDFLQRLAPITLRRLLKVERPGHIALKGIHREVWKSRVLILTPEQVE